MNFTHIAGHLGADPEVRFTSTGKKVTTLRLAARTRKGQTEDTIWWRVTIWGDQYDKMIPYFKKGSAVVVGGELHKPEIFNDREGKPQISMEITASFVQFSPFGKPGGSSSAPADGQGTFQQGSSQQSAATPPFSPYGQTSSSSDDEVPF